MFTLILPAVDDIPAVELHMEHSLVSLSKWEQLHEKAFFNREGMNAEETLSYFNQMLLTPPPKDWTNRLSGEQAIEINNYINRKMTATWFREEGPQRGPQETITNELIYYWMVSFSIPFLPCETWHLNHLMTLIKVCGVKQTKPKPMSKRAQAEEYRRLNAERRQQLGTSG